MGSGWLNFQAMQPIEESFNRFKQFTADASHELRSPLMAISTNIEVALTYPEGMRPGDGEKFKAIALAIEQMTQLTEDLLLLTRTDKIGSNFFNFFKQQAQLLYPLRDEEHMLQMRCEYALILQ